MERAGEEEMDPCLPIPITLKTVEEFGRGGGEKEIETANSNNANARGLLHHQPQSHSILSLHPTR